MQLALVDSDHLAAGIDLPRSRQAGIREIERREVSSVQDIPMDIEVLVQAPVTDVSSLSVIFHASVVTESGKSVLIARRKPCS